MKFLTRTIIALVILNLTTAGPASAMKDASKDKTLTVSGSTRLFGVEMVGLPGNPVTDERGYYVATVPYGWSGTVTPRKEGFAFRPASMSYSRIVVDQTNEDYAAKLAVFTISGSAGVPGVTMIGLPGNPVSGSKGGYRVTVNHGWSGTVTPTREGYTFEPASLPYSRVMADKPNGNFAAKPAMLTISGRLAKAGNPIEGVLISADNDGGSDTTDTQGRYSLKIPYGWSGSVYPSKEGIVFNPPSMTLTNVTTNIVNGEPEQARGGGSDPFGGFGSSRPRGRSSSRFKPAIRSSAVGRKVLVIPAGEIQADELAETVEDMHVMSHILDEGFKEKRRIQGFFTDFGDFFGRDSRSAEATYLQGFGVLFVMEVNFAFSPPARKQAQESTETTDAADSTWLKARRQVFSPGMGQEDSTDDYNNQMVEELKRELIGSLKHASNIRNVKPEEWIILTVIGGQRQFGMGSGGGLPMGGSMSTFGGSARSGGSSHTSGMMGGMGGFSSGGGYATSSYGGGSDMMMGGMGDMYGSMPPQNGTMFSSSTVLTIRTKKSNVDDFAKGALDFAQFQNKVTILMY